MVYNILIRYSYVIYKAIRLPYGYKKNICSEHRMSLETLRIIIAEKVSEFRLSERNMSEFTESLSLSVI